MAKAPAAAHAEREHAPFSPSSSDRWLICPASVPLSEGKDDNSQTIYTVSGTMCHEKSEEFLRNWKDPAECDDILTASYVNASGKKEKVVQGPKVWKSHVVPYVEAVRDVYSEQEIQDLEPILLVEEKVVIEGAQCYGTLDAAVVVVDKSVDLFDLKCGSGHIVEADGAQFKTYLIGLMDKYVSKEARKYARFTVHICQSADDARPHKKFTWHSTDLEAHRKEIRKAIKEAPTAEAGPIGDHCNWCKAAASCPANRAIAMSVLDDDPTQEISLLPANLLSTEQKAHVLANAKVVRKWLDAVEAECLNDAMAGNVIPGHKLVRANTNRKWDPEKGEDAIAAELELLDIDPWNKKLISFTEVEKKLKAIGGDVNHLVVKPEGGIVLAPESDKRPPIDRLAILDD